MVGEELLGPSTELMAGPTVIGDFLNRITIADPVKMGAPNIGSDAGECPAAASDFTNEGVVVGFGGGAATGAGMDGLEAGGGECGVEGDRGRIAGLKESNGSGGGVGVFGLHEDEGHGRFGPVGFDKERKGAVIAAQKRVGEELGFKVVEKSA